MASTIKSINKESREIDQLIQNSANTVCSYFIYSIGVVTSIKGSKWNIYNYYLLKKEILLVIVSDSGIVKNTILSRWNFRVLNISNYLNSKLKGLLFEKLESNG